MDYVERIEVAHVLRRARSVFPDSGDGEDWGWAWNELHDESQTRVKEVVDLVNEALERLEGNGVMELGTQVIILDPDQMVPHEQVEYEDDEVKPKCKRNVRARLVSSQRDVVLQGAYYSSPTQVAYEGVKVA